MHLPPFFLGPWVCDLALLRIDRAPLLPFMVVC